MGGEPLAAAMASEGFTTMTVLTEELAYLLEQITEAIFDLNGVLMDDEPVHFAAFSDVVAERGQVLSYEEYLAHCAGRTDAEGFLNLLSKKPLRGDVSTMVTEKREAYLRCCTRFEDLVLSWAADLAAELDAKGVMCHLVTSSDADVAGFFLKRCALNGIFAGRTYFEVGGTARLKVYRSVADRARGGAAACLVIDDTPANLVLARRCGLKTLGIATTHPKSSLDADVIVCGL
jgi:beta-phosphoglucomutase